MLHCIEKLKQWSTSFTAIFTNIKIPFDILVPGLLFGVSLSLYVFYTITTLQDQKSVALVINIAGRQRLLLQQFTNEVLIKYYESQASGTTIKPANHTYELFEVSLKALKDGGKTYSDFAMSMPIIIPAAHAPSIRLALSHLQENWISLRKAVAFGATTASQKQISNVKFVHDRALSSANRLVALMTTASHDKMTAMLRIQWAILVTTVIFGIWFGYFMIRIIREKHAAELSRQEGEGRFRKIVENIDAVFWMMAPGANKMLYVSPAYESIWGYSCQSLYEDPLSRFNSMHDVDCARVKANLEPLLNHGIFNEEYRIIKPDNSIHWIQDCAFPIFDHSGNIQRIAGFARDISASKTAEKALTQAKEAAQQADLAKSAFLANMSHEIRTPLNAITGLTYLALTDDTPPKLHDYLLKIRNTNQTLLAIINDILDFSKIEAGKLEIVEKDFQISDVMATLAQLFSHTIAEKGLEFFIDIDANIPTTLVGDALRLGQVLTNLVGNAVKFTQTGEIVVRVFLKERTVSTENTQLRLLFIITDTGIGIDSAHIPKLFSAFSQADDTITRKFGGSGLGLAISRRLVDIMHGEVEVKSQKDQGSTFQFSVVVTARSPTLTKQYQLPQDIHGNRVLIVDEHPTAHEILCNNLTAFGFACVSVVSGKAALLELIDNVDDASKQPYKLAIINNSMAAMGGQEVARRIKNSQNIAQIPAIILMIDATEETVLSGDIVDSVISKPVLPDALFDAIMCVFGKRERSNQQVSQRITEKTLPDRIKGAHILLVEDNEINQQVAKEILERASFKVTLAENGKEALQLIAKTVSPSFDAVLMDLQMPEMDGYETTKRIRRNSEDKSLPIIAMTANAMISDREKCLAVGMNDHLAKPINVEQLFSLLNKWISTPSSTAITSANNNCHKHKDAHSFPQSLPGFDIQVGLARLQGEPQLYCKLLKSFHKNYRMITAKISTAIQYGDIAMARGIVHDIKGMAGNLSANKLYTTAKALETHIQQHGVSSCATLLEQFAQDLNQVIASIELIADIDESSIPQDQGENNSAAANINVAHVHLTKLYHLLEDNDIDAELQLVMVTDFLNQAGFETERQRIESCMAVLDYKGAHAHLRILGKALNLELISSTKSYT